MANQKLYLIPTTPSYEYEPYDHIYLVKASSSQEAYNRAKSKLDANIPQELQEYESYNCNVESYLLPQYPFQDSEKYDILNSIFLNTKGFEHMAYFNVNWNDYTDELSKLAAQEEWSNTTYPDKKILTNYMVHTYKKNLLLKRM